MAKGAVVLGLLWLPLTAHAAETARGPVDLQTIKGLQPLALRCYQAELPAHPDLEGRLMVSVKTGPAAEVVDVTVSEDKLGNSPVTACVFKEARSLKFPPSAANTTFQVPLAFSGKARPLAVLPFENQSGDEGLAWIRSAVAESLMVKLGQVRSLLLVDRMRLQEVLKEQALAQSGAVDPGTSVKLGELAGARMLVMGSYFRAGKELRITSRVVDVEDGRVRWAGAVTGKLDEILSLLDHVAEDLATAMNVVIDDESAAALATRVSSSTEELTLLGNASNEMSSGHPEKAVGMYQQLSKLNPRLPEAYLGEAWARNLSPTSDDDGLPAIRKAAEAALALRPNYHEALTLMGTVAWREHKLDDAVAFQKRALAVKPDYPMGCYMLGVAYATQGKVDDALANLAHAVELQPQESEFRTQYGMALSVFGGDHARALAMSGAALKDPGTTLWAYGVHAGNQLRAGDSKGCVTTVDDGRKRFPDQVAGRHGSYLSLVQAACLGKEKRFKDMQRVLKDLGPDGVKRLTEHLPPGELFKREFQSYLVQLKH